MILENATPFERDTYLTETSLNRLIRILLADGPLSTSELQARLPSVDGVLEQMRIKGIVEAQWKLITPSPKDVPDEPEQLFSSEVKN